MTIEVVNELVAFIQEHAVREGHFILTSGVSSTHYFDVKAVTLNPRGLDLVGDAVVEVISQYPVRAVGGMEMGSIPIMAAVMMKHTMRSTQRITPITGYVIRKEPRSHGTKSRIEGTVPDSGVVVIEDVVTSGGSLLAAIQVLIDAGYAITCAITIVDRSGGTMSALMAKKGIPYHALVTSEQLGL